MSWSRPKAAALGFLLLLFAGCGFEPLYKETSAAPQLRNSVLVEAAGGGIGYEVETALAKRFGSPSAARFRVQVRASVAESEVAAGWMDGFQRSRLDGAAEFEVAEVDGGRALYSGVVDGSVSYSSTRETFHTLTARRDARRRLALQLAERIARRLEATSESWLK
ncbi:MAG: hypothetical protein OXC26_07485 [Albidovulum sp.]|nr:hypothetical protein [Albidovulum sp.]